MQQEINLYLLLPQQRKSFLTIRVLTLSYSVFIAFLIIQFCVEYWGMRHQRANIAVLEHELGDIDRRKEAIHAEYPMLELKDMENSLKKLQQELTEKNNVFNLLTQDKNFSNYLLGVSKASVNGLWIKDVRVEIGDRNIVLKGYATHSDAIQLFINNLALQQEFHGFNFQLQKVNQVEINKEVLLNFIISTKVKAENEV